MSKYYQYQSIANAPPVMAAPTIISTTVIENFHVVKKNTGSSLGDFNFNSPQIISQQSSLFTTYALDNWVSVIKNTSGNLGDFVFNSPQIIASGTPIIASQFADAPVQKKVWDTGGTWVTFNGFLNISPPLTPGVITIGTITNTTIAVTATNAAGGVLPYTYQYATRLSGIGTYVNFALTTRNGTITGLTAGMPYDIRLTYTDGASNVVTAFALDIRTTGGVVGFGMQIFPIGIGVGL